MPPKRILFPYVGDSVGGSHISSLTLAGALPPDRYTPVIAVHQDGPLHSYTEGRGMAWITAPRVAYPDTGRYIKQIGRYARALPALMRFLREHQIDVVHSHDIRMHLTWAPAARLCGIPHVWHQRTPTSARRLDRYTALSSRVIGVSRYCAAQFPPAMQARADVIFNPFDIPPAPDSIAAGQALRQQLGLAADAKIVLFVANLAPRKRPLLFVEIARRLSAENRDTLHFIMLGESRAPYDAELAEAISDADLGARLRHMGPQYPITPWMAGADLMIAPAVHEALGRTMIEAQLLGTPVVASDTGGNPEIITDGATGLLAPADDAAALTAAAARLLDDPALAAQIAAQARTSAIEKFALARHLAAMEQVYDGLPPA